MAGAKGQAREAEFPGRATCPVRLAAPELAEKRGHALHGVAGDDESVRRWLIRPRPPRALGSHSSSRLRQRLYEAQVPQGRTHRLGST